ncbi:MAG: O-antigen ligase family protein [Bacteroidia bacterium]|nr:O-antigen ligase family protein [Bacteroidia bacterium]
MILQIAGLIIILLGMGFIMAKAGLLAAMGFAALPLVGAYLVWHFTQPQIGLWIALGLCTVSAGLTRYIPLPWGLFIDIFLALTWLTFIFQKFSYTDWSPLNHDFMKFTLVWFGFMCFELVNPEAKSFVAWFYAMRSIGIDMIMTIGMIFLLLPHHKNLTKFINFICWISILAAIWGMRQKFIGTDAAENRWLAKEENGSTHILFGSLRTFSFHSDAGQFGGNMAMMTLVAGILAMGPGSIWRRGFFAITSVLCLVGFGISGSRGALVCPAVGGIVFLFMKKNFKILILGFIVGGSLFYTLKYTFALQGVEAVRRMRTAMDPDNPSLQTRLRNQKTYRRYLATRPIGAGIGSAGYWGKRFSPGSVPAETATDSYYVRVWAEMGIIGLLFNIAFLGYWIGRAGNIIWHLRDPVLIAQTTAIYCGAIGMFFSSYGNQILSGFPTNMYIYFGMTFTVMARTFEQQKIEENLFQPEELEHAKT